MEKENKYELPVLNSMERTLINSVRIQLLIVVVAIIGLISGFYLYKSAIINSIDRVYVVKDMGIERVMDKKVMIKGHVGNFYKLFFQIDQFTYKNNINQALELIGSSGKDLYISYKNKDYFSKLISLNLSITVDIDYINIYGKNFPYQVDVYAKRRIYNSYGSLITNLNAQLMVYPSTCTDKNPYGLIIDKFKIFDDSEIKQEKE